MDNFYKEMRISIEILLDKNTNPTGGKWSFDKDNRKKLPKDIAIPKIPVIKETEHTHKLKPFIESKFKSHPGHTKDFWFATTRKDSIKLLDKFFEKKIINFLKKQNITFEIIPTPMFLCSRVAFKEYLKKYKKPFMANFYKEMRISNKILLDKNNNPTGGKWSFDKDNRKKLPKDISIPKIPVIKETEHTHKLKSLIDSKFKSHPGHTKEFWFATTRKDSIKLLDDYYDKRLNIY